GEWAGLVQDRLRDSDLPDVVEDGAELDVPNLLEAEPELGGDRDGEPHDLLRVLARDGVLGLERVRERSERLAVEALRPVLVLEGGEQRADLRGGQLGQVP